MKKLIYTLVIIFISNIIVKAQVTISNVRLDKSDRVYNGINHQFKKKKQQEKRSQTNTYLLKSIKLYNRILDNNNNIYNYIDSTIFTYDVNGNMLSKIDKTLINNMWIDSINNTNTYNSNGNILTSLFQQWKNIMD